MEKNTPAGSIVLSSDIGAVTLPPKQFCDVAGLANRTQLDAVVERRDLFETVVRRRPNYIVDTVGADGILSVEKILSTPEAYYVDGGRIPSSCRKMPTFTRTKLGTWPEPSTGPLRIDAFRIHWLVRPDENCVAHHKWGLVTKLKP